jgi:hypothetical protein
MPVTPGPVCTHWLIVLVAIPLLLLVVFYTGSEYSPPSRTDVDRRDSYYHFARLQRHHNHLERATRSNRRIRAGTPAPATPNEDDNSTT